MIIIARRSILRQANSTVAIAASLDTIHECTKRMEKYLIYTVPISFILIPFIVVTQLRIVVTKVMESA